MDERRIRLQELFDMLEEGPQLPPQYKDERMAPEVDRDALLSLVRGELPSSHARLLYTLIYYFKNWHDAFTEVLIEQTGNGPRQGE